MNQQQAIREFLYQEHLFYLENYNEILQGDTKIIGRRDEAWRRFKDLLYDRGYITLVQHVNWAKNPFLTGIRMCSTFRCECRVEDRDFEILH